MVMALCLLVTLPLELVLGARVYARIRQSAAAVVPVAVVFGVLDEVAIARGLWHYDGHYLTGVSVPVNLPIEEVVFFLVVPLCALLTFEAVGRVTRSRVGRVERSGRRA